MKKAFSLIELIIAMAILGIILSAMAALFIVSVKNYRRESQRNFMQKEINFTADDLGVQIKQASAAPLTYNEYTRDENTLILSLPSIDNNEDFIYAGGTLLTDYYVYYNDGGTLYKKIIPNPASSREEKDSPILKNVNEFSCTYTPQDNTESITCSIGTTLTISGNNLNFSATKTSRLRNYR